MPGAVAALVQAAQRAAPGTEKQRKEAVRAEVESATAEVSEAIETADCLIGAKRMLEAVARQGQPTYDAIAPQDIADFIRAHRSDWPTARPQDAGVFAYLPEELKAPTAELLSRLDLPADTAFSDVVAAIRSGQGRLSELETSLLFLDEWKKQYG